MAQDLYLLGRGATAQLAALAANAWGVRFTHWWAAEKLAPKSAPARVLALSPPSLRLLEAWGVRGRAQPIRAMRLASGVRGGTSLRAREPLAYTMDEQELAEAIGRACERAELAPSAAPPRTKPSTNMDALYFATSRADADWCGMAQLASVPYHQSALSARITHAKPHHAIARQIFLPLGPLALLPLGDAKQSAVIWTSSQAHAQSLVDAPLPLFMESLEEQLGGALGRVREVSARACEPLQHYHRARFVEGNRIALGAAARRVHPLAGLGFNLGLRDIAACVQTLLAARRLGLPFGAQELWRDYARTRRADSYALHALTKTLNGAFRTNGARPLAGLGLRFWPVRAPGASYAQRGLGAMRGY